MNTLAALIELIDEVATGGLTLARTVVRIGNATIEIAVRILDPRR